MGKLSGQIGNIGPFDVSSVSFATQYASVAPSVTPTGATRTDALVSKNVDSSSAALFQAAANGQVFDTAKITFFKDDAGSAPSTVFNMTTVTIDSYASAGSGTESMDLTFSQISAQITATASSGDPGDGQ